MCFSCYHYYLSNEFLLTLSIEGYYDIATEKKKLIWLHSFKWTWFFLYDFLWSWLHSRRDSPQRRKHITKTKRRVFGGQKRLSKLFLHREPLSKTWPRGRRHVRKCLFTDLFPNWPNYMSDQYVFRKDMSDFFFLHLTLLQRTFSSSPKSVCSTRSEIHFFQPFFLYKPIIYHLSMRQ